MAICDVCKHETFHYFILGGKNVCRRCPSPRAHNVPGSMFPFVTAHLDGRDVTVNSLYHLRKLESQHGVDSFAFNADSKNWNDVPVTRFDQIQAQNRAEMRRNLGLMQ